MLIRGLTPLLAVLVACAEAQSPLPASPATQSVPAPARRESAAQTTDSTYVAALRAQLGGNDVALTLNPRLQASAERIVRETGKAAALVALSADTGEILAVASVAGERGDPLLVAHLPASTFKPLLTLAALESGALQTSSETVCSGSYDFEGQRFTCPRVHGRQNAARAIATSCNAFFYELGTRVEPARVVEVARRFGYGARTGIELQDEPGFVPEGAAVRAAGRLVEAIGHGQIKITLLQLARAYAAIANGGKLPPLRLVRTRASADASGGALERMVGQPLELRASHLEFLRSALLETVAAEHGRAHSVALPGFPFAGKTGGSEAPPLPGSASQVEPSVDGWFVAYAPATAAKVVVAARVERGSGAPTAVVRALLDTWRASESQGHESSGQSTTGSSRPQARP
jgi:penicillin-binding protein 2